VDRPRSAGVAPEPALQLEGDRAEARDGMTAARVAQQAVGERAEGQSGGGRDVHGRHSPDRPARSPP
jgi:hypothetical protein